MRQLAEHVAYSVEEHGAIQTVDFPFSDIDEALGYIHHTPPSGRAMAGELLRQLLIWCCGSNGTRSLRSATTRFVAVVSGLRPEILLDRTGRDLACELGISRQALSHQAVKFEDAFGIKFARCRSKEARQRMAAARRGGPNRNTQHQSNDDITPTQPA
jgi:hypothetical protein